MKKLLFACVLSGFMFFFLINQANAKLKVVTTFTILADITKNIAKDKADVESIIKPGAGIHNYQPTPKDIVKVQNANLILWNGLNLEKWFEKFFYDLHNVPNVIVSEGITPISIYESDGLNTPNPHAWMSLTNVVTYINNIQQALVKYDSINAKYYQANAKIYLAKINNLREEIIKNLAFIPKDKRVLVTSEGAFSYFVKDIGFKELYLWSVNAEQQGTPQQVKKVLLQVTENKLPVIFSESTVSDKPARQIAKDANVLYGGVLYVDSLSSQNGPATTYLDLLSNNAKIIVDAFKKTLNQ